MPQPLSAFEVGVDLGLDSTDEGKAAIDFSDDAFGQQETEAVATPGPVDPCSQALGAGKGAAQENLRVKNDSEPGQRGRPRRS